MSERFSKHNVSNFMKGLQQRLWIISKGDNLNFLKAVTKYFNLYFRFCRCHYMGPIYPMQNIKMGLQADPYL